MSSVLIESQNLLEKPELVNDYANYIFTSRDIEIHKVCKEMTDYFKGTPSDDFIRKHLDEKYKNEVQADNAKKSNYTKLKNKLIKQKLELEETAKEVSIAQVLFESTHL